MNRSESYLVWHALSRSLEPFPISLESSTRPCKVTEEYNSTILHMQIYAKVKLLGQHLGNKVLYKSHRLKRQPDTALEYICCEENWRLGAFHLLYFQNFPVYLRILPQKNKQQYPKVSP